MDRRWVRFVAVDLDRLRATGPGGRPVGFMPAPLPLPELVEGSFRWQPGWLYSLVVDV